MKYTDADWRIGYSFRKTISKKSAGPSWGSGYAASIAARFR